MPANTLSKPLHYLHLPADGDLPDLKLPPFLAIVLVYLVLGMFVDGIAMMVITIPFIVPIMTNAHMDLVWMGVVVCIMIEVGLLTPPVGLNLYVLQGVTGESMRDVIVGAAPFIALQFAMVAALYYWPDIAMYLPRLVMG